MESAKGKAVERPVEERPGEKERVVEEEERVREEEPLVRGEPRRVMMRSMISPAARDAPRFSSRRPQELRRFLRSMEDLFRDAGVDNDEEKKSSIGKYADQESEEEWRALGTFYRGHSWNDFKEELMRNYPEAAEAERGTPARIKQVCSEARGIELGDLSALFAFRRAFMAEAKKLTKKPAAMANRELVELFLKTLSPTFAREVIQYLGNQAEIGKQWLLPIGPPKLDRRPEDRYDLEEVYKAAEQVSENSQGMFHFMNEVGREKFSKRKESNFNQSPSEMSNLVQKMENLENSQAEEKDRMVITNKNLDGRFNELENMMKSLLVQRQNGNGGGKEPVIPYDPNMGIKIGQPGTIPKWGPSGKQAHYEVDGECFYCGGGDHHIPACKVMKDDIQSGYVKLNHDGKLRMNDGGYIPNSLDGAPIRERVGRHYRKKQNQFYCGYDENDEVPEPVIPRYSAQFVHTTEDPTQRLARLERELSLKEKEDELETRKLKLEREEKKRAKQTSKPTCSPQVLELLEQMVKGDKADFQ